MIVFVQPVLSDHSVLSGHLAISRGGPLDTGSSVVRIFRNRTIVPKLTTTLLQYMVVKASILLSYASYDKSAHQNSFNSCEKKRLCDPCTYFSLYSLTNVVTIILNLPTPSKRSALKEGWICRR